MFSAIPIASRCHDQPDISQWLICIFCEPDSTSKLDTPSIPKDEEMPEPPGDAGPNDDNPDIPFGPPPGLVPGEHLSDDPMLGQATQRDRNRSRGRHPQNPQRDQVRDPGPRPTSALRTSPSAIDDEEDLGLGPPEKGKQPLECSVAAHGLEEGENGSLLGPEKTETNSPRRNEQGSSPGQQEPILPERFNLHGGEDSDETQSYPEDPFGDSLLAVDEGEWKGLSETNKLASRSIS